MNHIRKQLMTNSGKELDSSDKSAIFVKYLTRDRFTKWNKIVHRLDVRTSAYDILTKIHIFLNALRRKHVSGLKHSDCASLLEIAMFLLPH